MDSFFSNAKEIVWNTVKNVSFNPDFFVEISQQPRAGFIFYGPPGTGKSSFVTRLSIALKRHLINLDFRDFICKSDMYAEIMTPRLMDNGIRLQQKEVIFILDEFDLLVNELWDLSNSTTKEQNKKEIIDNHKNMNSTELCNLLKDFSLCDLVELFQGSIPCDGLIIIAITNDYEKIYEKCPKLFREGRLTPIKFDYMDKKILNELCMHYFGQPLNIKFDGLLKYPTSAIIEKAMACKLLNNEGINSFRNYIKELIHN
jgi:SpoVK/Ycf46/Vps4 family AAA+-type ATPase